MTDEPMTPSTPPVGGGKPRRTGVLKSVWRRIRKPLTQSRFAKGVLASLLAQALRFVERTNPLVKGSSDLEKARQELSPRQVDLHWSSVTFCSERRSKPK